MFNLQCASGEIVEVEESDMQCLGQTIVNMCQDSIHCTDEVIPVSVFPNAKQFARYLVLCRLVILPLSPCDLFESSEFFKMTPENNAIPHGMWLCLCYATFMENDNLIEVLSVWLRPYMEKWDKDKLDAMFEAQDMSKYESEKKLLFYALEKGHGVRGFDAKY